MRRNALIAIVGVSLAIVGIGAWWLLSSPGDTGELRPGTTTYLGQELAEFPDVSAGSEPFTVAEMVATGDVLSPQRTAELYLPFEQAGQEFNWETWAYIVDADTGEVLLDRGGDVPHTPASTMKVLTGLASLATLDPDLTLETGTALLGTDLYLWGEGDLLLAAQETRGAVVGHASLGTLAEETAAALQAQGLATVDLRYQDKLFEGPLRPTSWVEQDVSTHAGDVAPFAINTGQSPTGWGYVPNSALYVAEVFAARLAENGITVTSIAAGTNSEAPVIASIESATAAAQLAHMLRQSNNTLAEQYCHLAAEERGNETTFVSSANTVREILTELGLDSQSSKLSDCSGLDKTSQITPKLLVESLQVSYENPTTAQLLRYLPRGGVNGTLTDRFTGEVTFGNVQAKTGLLGQATTLAGVVTTETGQTLLFAVGVDDVPENGAYLARPYIDDFVGALAGE